MSIAPGPATMRQVSVGFAGERLLIDLAVSAHGQPCVVLAHGNGNVLHSHSIAEALRAVEVSTATCQLLTDAERHDVAAAKAVIADVALMTARLGVVIAELRAHHGVDRVGILASGTFAAAAMTFAGRHPAYVGAIVSRGGRIDLVSDPSAVRCPTLLIAAGADSDLIRMNETVFQRLCCTKGFDVLAGATHRFDQPATFELVSKLTCDWFLAHLSGVPA
jgi:putative phosphoribosyl transferase